VGGLGWHRRQSTDIASYFPLREMSLKSLAILVGSAPLPTRARELLREVKGVVLAHGQFLAVASATVLRSVYTCAKPPSTNNSTPET
jgi:hypothetical protein